MRAAIALCADLSEVARMNLWLDAEMERAGLGPTVANDFKVCLNEAVTNVISYAFEGIAAPELNVELEFGKGVATALIRDNGTPFDPLARPEVAAPESLNEARIGGLGIKLIRELSSRVDYARRDGWNCLTIACGG